MTENKKRREEIMRCGERIKMKNIERERENENGENREKMT